MKKLFRLNAIGVAVIAFVVLFTSCKRYSAEKKFINENICEYVYVCECCDNANNEGCRLIEKISEYEEEAIDSYAENPSLTDCWLEYYASTISGYSYIEEEVDKYVDNCSKQVDKFADVFGDEFYCILDSLDTDTYKLNKSNYVKNYTDDEIFDMWLGTPRNYHRRSGESAKKAAYIVIYTAISKTPKPIIKDLSRNWLTKKWTVTFTNTEAYNVRFFVNEKEEWDFDLSKAE